MRDAQIGRIRGPVSKRRTQRPEARPWKLLLWTAVAGLIFGLIGAGESFEDMFRVARNGIHEHNATSKIVVIKIDDQSLRQFGNWPWPRTYQAQLVNRLSEARTNRIFYDINFSFASGEAEDRAFAEAIKRSGRVTLLTRSKIGPNEGIRVDSRPLPRFAQHARLGVASVE